MTNQFDSSGEGEQNIAQGDHAIGKQENVTQEVRGDGCISSGSGNVTAHGIPPEVVAHYMEELGVTEQVVIQGFLSTLLEHDVPRQHKDLLARVGNDQAVRQAIEAGDYVKAEELLKDAARRHTLAAAEVCAAQARLQELQLHYEKAAACWQKGTALLPEESKEERFLYLHEAGCDLERIGKYTEAVPLYEQMVALSKSWATESRKGRRVTASAVFTGSRATMLPP